MTEKSEFIDEILGLFQKVFRGLGLDALTANLVSIIYLEPEEISMDALAELTGYSLSAVSTKLKPIESLGMIERRKHPGSKKLYFYMDKDLVKLNQSKIHAAMNNQILPLKQNLPLILNNYKKKELSEKDKKRHDIAKGYIDQLMIMEKLLKKMLVELEKIKNE